MASLQNSTSQTADPTRRPITSRIPPHCPTDREGLYEPLQPWQTRVIRLLPGWGLDKITCELHIADIIQLDGLGLPRKSTIETFEAVSYSWGRPDLTAEITCNDISLMIPPPLADALRCFRRPYSARWLWCDAICVNQADDIEKAIQVSLMFTIFQKAFSVLAWLGELPEKDLKVFQRRVNMTPQEVEKQNNDPSLPSILREILSRGWWNRSWVRQEVYAAAELILHLGRVGVNFKNLMIIIQDTDSNLKPQLDPYSMRDNIRSQNSSLSTKVGQIMHSGALLGASDERDRIYSNLGMLQTITAAPWQDVQVSYSRPVIHVNQDFMIAILDRDGTLRYMDILGPRNLSSSRPSWLSDWAACHKGQAVFVGGLTDRKSDRLDSSDNAGLKHRPRYGRVSDQLRSNVGPRLRPRYEQSSGQLELEGYRLWTGAVTSHRPVLKHVARGDSDWYPTVDKSAGEGSMIIRTLESWLVQGLYKAVSLLRAASAPEFQAEFGVCVPSATNETDVLALLVSSSLLYVLRPNGEKEDKKYFLLVGLGWFWSRSSSRNVKFTFKFEDWQNRCWQPEVASDCGQLTKERLRHMNHQLSSINRDESEEFVLV